MRPSIFGSRMVVLAFACAFMTVAATGARDASFTATALGGLRGDTYVAHRSGDRFEYSEFVTIDFTDKVDLTSFREHFTISPQTPVGMYGLEYGHRVRLNIRKIPGVAYTLTVAAGLLSRSGGVTDNPLTYTITTASDPQIPVPLRSTTGEAYRYGTLGHPFRDSLAGPSADRIIALLTNAGVRFVRIDYCANQILGDDAPRTQPNFATEDAILDKLVRAGISELPILDQYCAPKWAANGRPYPAIFADPKTFAQFAGVVAGHLAERYPTVTRVEIFNEPNLHGWWRYPGSGTELAKRSGSGAAPYMSSAYAAIKAAAPKMTVVGPALSDGGAETDPRAFLRELYANGCGRGRCWDVLSVHNYRWMNPDFSLDPSVADRFDVYKDLQHIAAEHGDPNTHVMLTEWGFSHVEKINGFDPRVQAQYIALGFNRMLADPTVDGIVYVNVYNGGKANDFWAQTQVVDSGFKPLPGYDVLRTFGRR